MLVVYDVILVKGCKVLMIFIVLFILVVMFFLCYYFYGYVEIFYSCGWILFVFGFEIWWIYIWVLVGFVIIGIQYFLIVVKNLISRDVYLFIGVVDGYYDIELEV